MRHAIRLTMALCLTLTPIATHAADIAIVGAKIYPTPDAPAIPNAVILLHDGRIAAVGPRATTPIPKGVTIVAAPGKVITAGFWNCHVHLIASGLLHPQSLSDTSLSAAMEKMFTSWGFTTVFDLASTMASANAIRARIDAGAVTGPNILTVGEPFYPPGGTPIYARPIYSAAHLPSAEITTTAAAAARVSTQIGEGANGIKLFTGAIVGGKQGVLYMSAQDIRAITTQAHLRGVQTFAHPTDAEGTNLAVDNGVDILAHTESLGGPWSPAFVAKLRARNVALIPTLMLFEVDPDPRTPVETSLQQLKSQAQSGGDVLFGTDAGFIDVYDPTEEYRLMARVMDWRAILASLTTTPARRFGRANYTGKIKPGFAADLVILDTDPADDVSAFSKIQSAFRQGKQSFFEKKDQKTFTR